MAGFELMPDRRTPECTHDQTQGCPHCCVHCAAGHRCGGCWEPLDHQGHEHLGTCTACRQGLFTDPEE